jgi:hypothetical protein
MGRAMEGYLDERSSRAWAYCYVMPSTSPPTCGHFVLSPSLDQAAWGMRWLKRQQHARTPLRGSSWSTHSRLGPDPLCRISIPRAQPSSTPMADRCPSCLVTRSVNDAIVMIQLLLSGYSYSGTRTPSTCVSPRRSLACDDVMPSRSQRGSGCALQPCMICNRIVSHLISSCWFYPVSPIVAVQNLCHRMCC